MHSGPRKPSLLGGLGQESSLKGGVVAEVSAQARGPVRAQQLDRREAVEFSRSCLCAKRQRERPASGEESEKQEILLLSF